MSSINGLPHELENKSKIRGWLSYIDHKVVYFFGELAHKLGHSWFDRYWKVIHTIHPWRRYHIVDTGLPPGYYDPDTRIMHAMFNELKKFVEFYVRNGYECTWSATEEHLKWWNEMLRIYNWWVKVRPVREELWDKDNPTPDRGFGLDELFEPVPGTTYSRLKEPTPEYHEWLDKFSDIECQWQEEDKAMMKALIDVMPCMWYP